MSSINLEKEHFYKNTKIKPVLNFNFSTHMLFRCIQKKYAEDFIKGKIRFNQPKVWIKQEENGNKGQGDSLEGVFLATDVNDNSRFINNLKKDDKNEFFLKNNLIYFRRKETTELYCLCLYGLNSNMFINKDTDRFGYDHYFARISKDYFSDFSSEISEEEYFTMDELDRPVVLFINNPHKIFEKIKDFFVKFGISKEDIIISPVEYVELRKRFVNFVPNPYELLLKDKDFINQNEVRIIINSHSEELLNYMQKNNNIIDIGNIADNVEIYDNYFHDLLIEKNGNTILFTLPFPIKQDLLEFTLRKLLSIYVQVYNDELPYETTIDERKQLLNAIEKIIKEKYNIVLDIINGQINLSNVNGDIEDLLDK